MQIDDFVIGVHLVQFQKQIPKSTDVVHAVCQQILPIVKNFVLYPLYQDEN